MEKNENINYDLTEKEAIKILVRTFYLSSKYECEQFINKRINIGDIHYSRFMGIAGDDKLSIIVFIVKNYPKFIFDLCQNGYITNVEIAHIQEKVPELFYYLPFFMYQKYNNVKDMLKNNVAVDRSKLPLEVKNGLRYFGIRTSKDTNNSKTKKKKDAWYNSDGSLYQFVKMNNGFVFQSMSDYDNLIKTYYKVGFDDYVVFCDLFGIGDYKDFKRLMDSYEKKYGKSRLVDMRNEAINENESEMDIIASKFNNNEISFEDYFKNYFSLSHRFSYFYKKSKDKDAFFKMFIDYIIANKYVLPYDKIKILFGMDDPAYKLKYYISKSSLEKNETIRKLLLSVSSYNVLYKKNQVECSLTIEGNKYVIDDYVVNNALEYLKNNDVYICHYTVYFACIRIVTGELDVTSEERKNVLNREK